jgi:hypothetical protein
MEHPITGETDSLRALAHKCRSLAKGVSTPGVAETLSEMARDYEVKAEKAEARIAPLAGAAPASPGR